MRFWDSSAIIPLLVSQPATRVVGPLIEEVGDAAYWWGTPVECASAMARLRCEGGLSAEEEAEVHALAEELLNACVEVQPSDRIRGTAARLVRTHPLRAADALHLAAALEWAGTPQGHVLVTLDERMAEAARLEGFRVLPATSRTS